MRYGQHAESVLNAALEKRHPIPADAIAPDLLDECKFSYEAFKELSTDRPPGFGLAQIPWSAIDRYATRYKLHDIDEFDSFVAMIRAMDAVYMSHHTPKDSL